MDFFDLLNDKLTMGSLVVEFVHFLCYAGVLGAFCGCFMLSGGLMQISTYQM